MPCRSSCRWAIHTLVTCQLKAGTGEIDEKNPTDKFIVVDELGIIYHIRVINEPPSTQHRSIFDSMYVDLISGTRFMLADVKCQPCMPGLES